LLWIIGKPRDHEIQASIERKAERLSNVMLCLQRLPDEQMATVLSAADVFVVPSALSIATSGSAMLGLTYGCRLVAPAVNQIVSSVPTSLNALFLFGNDEPSALRAALDKARSSESPPYKPMRQLMMDRWDEAADAVMRAYRPSVSTT
jgi:glycogen synthase